MSFKLSSLVQAADDPMVLLYVINNLGRGVPNRACFASTVQTMRVDAMRSLVSGQWQIKRMRNNQMHEIWKLKQLELIVDQLMPALLEQQERQLTAMLFQQASLSLFIDKLVIERPSILQKQLKSDNTLIRLVALSAIARRHLHLENDLIELLGDPHPAVQAVAHKTLICVTRGTDFGPFPGASQKSIARSIEKWRQWQALQRSASPEKIAKGAAIAAAGKQAKIAPLEIVPFVLVGNEQPELPAEAVKMSGELVNAKGDEQLAVLARLRDSKGIDNTDALALAIPKLSGDIQRQARDALTQRLTRMTAATLRNKLQDDNVEVRHAAALACGRKNAKEHIPDLLQLLDDAEVDVVQSARMALTELTGEDFGPPSDAGSRKRAEAAETWRKWWKERQDRQK